MRTSALAALLCLAAAAARAQQPRLGWADVFGMMSYTGGLYNTRSEVEAPLFKTGVYRLGARVRTQRSEQLHGTEEEYSASLTRELFHVTVKGRLGTAPPSSQEAGYHLVAGEGWLYFYGLTLGPEHPELAEAVWESSGPAPKPEALDRTWVTKFGGRYTNTDHHIWSPASVLVVVENTSQFELRETCKERTSLAAYYGVTRYNRVLGDRARTILKSNVDYPGAPFAEVGWPNQYEGVELWQRYRGWKASFAGTRLNQLDNKLDILYGAELERELGASLRARAGYYHVRRRGNISRDASGLGVSYVW